MKAETYKTLLAMDKADPMTPAQRKAVAQENDDEIMTIRQVAELTGLTERTIRSRKRDLPPMGFTRLKPIVPHSIYISLQPSMCFQISSPGNIIFVPSTCFVSLFTLKRFTTLIGFASFLQISIA